MTQLDDAQQTTAAPTVRVDLRPASHPAPSWSAAYVRRLAITDAIAITLACLAAYGLRFSQLEAAPDVDGGFGLSYVALTTLLGLAWWVGLAMVRSRHRRIVGSGPAEYSRVFTAALRLFAVVAVLAYLAKVDVGRAYLAITFPIGLALLFTGRYLWRQWLKRQRAQGLCRSRLILAGHRDTADELIRELKVRPEAGYAVVGVCVPAAELERSSFVAGVPVVGDFIEVPRVAETLGADAVAVTGSDRMTAAAVRQLGWDLEPTGIDLVVATALTDIAGPRIVMTPVNGLPLVHVDAPRFAGAKYVLKFVVDWSAAAMLTLVLSPVLLAIAIAIKSSSRGPVLFRQERVGLNGTPFPMLKFRTMEAGAEERLDEVLGDVGVGIYYKRRDDPRVTRVGRTLRKHSLDELPQLFNVLRGEMSLVGPRPQIEREVLLYDRRAGRRLLVKPGLTGLWQVSGRSELSPEESVRMDVFYVENWTIFGDLIILARTAKVMLTGEGAY